MENDGLFAYNYPVHTTVIRIDYKSTRIVTYCDLSRTVRSKTSEGEWAKSEIDLIVTLVQLRDYILVTADLFQTS